MNKPPDHRLNVLMVGPPESSGGGMYAVADGIIRGLRAAGSPTRVILVDSGGGRGRSGYLRFPGAIADVVRLRPDVLHLHVASKGSTVRKSALAAAAHVAGVPYVIHLHGGGYADFLADLPSPARRAVQTFFRGAAHVVVLGEKWRSLVVDTLGVSSERVTVVHNGVPDIGLANPSSQEILFIGAATRDKGADVLVEAAQTVLGGGAHPGWTLRMVGGTPDPTIVTAARSGAAAGRIELSGPLYGSDKEEAIRGSALLVLPSRAEALPVVVLEAMAAGIPCICSDVGSVSEVLEDGVTGLLVPPGDRDRFTAALKTLVTDGALRRRMGIAARRRWADGLTQEALALSIEKIWRQVAVR